MNQVQRKEEAGALSTNLFEADANAGSQNMTQEDLALPFLKVLGQLSPEVNKQKAKFINGAEPGMIENSVTKELYDGAKGINVIPVHYERQYVEWQDRGQSGNAPVAIHSADSDIVSTTTRDKSWKDRLPNGNYLENTANHFVILMGKSPSTALISMKATQLKISRKWNSMMMSITKDGKDGPYTPPPFSHIYKLSSVKNTGKGNEWYGYNVQKISEITDVNLYKRAKSFYESCHRADQLNGKTS